LDLQSVNISWRTNLWLIPSLTVAAALLVFIVAQGIDWADYDGALILPRWLDQGSAADARSLLSATAGAIITTLGLVLSITVLTLSIAASQFGQRLLRRYMRDRGTQVCIGIFAATFVFSLLTLLSVTSRANEKEFVPWVSIWISTIGALTCIAVLIYFINHVALSIQVNNVLADLSGDFRWAISQNQGPNPACRVSIPEVRSDITLVSPATGYIQSIDYEALVAAAAEVDAVVRLESQPGQFVVQGTVLAVAEGDMLSQTQLEDEFGRAVIRIGVRRTLLQDPEFAIAQIVEIALRAMSPGVNDPNTAVTCVNWVADSLRILAMEPAGNPAHLDSEGNIRVIEKVNDFERIVAAAYGPIRQVARNSPMLTMAMLNSISLIVPFLQTTTQQETLHNQVRLAYEGLAADTVSGDRQGVEEAYLWAVMALQPINCCNRHL
jgi:uncharacterized membrane protein